jgi:outer membrane lipoprotein carrier protein
MKKIILFLFIVLLSAPVFGQTVLSKAQQNDIMKKIESNASHMQSMTCSFSQTKSMKMLSKKMIMQGVMYFKRPIKVRWQYMSPYDYTFILNGSKMKLGSKKSTRSVDMKDNKMFQQISNIIVNTFTGGNLNGQKEFTVQMYYGKGNAIMAKLFPRKKEIKQIYKEINLYFNPQLTMVSEVKMVEKTGDTTVISFKNVKTNVTINENLFSVR